MEALSFDEQLSRYFEEVLGIVPEQRLEEPDMQCDQVCRRFTSCIGQRVCYLMFPQCCVWCATFSTAFQDVAAAKIALLMREQSRVRKTSTDASGGFVLCLVVYELSCSSFVKLRTAACQRVRRSTVFCSVRLPPLLAPSLLYKCTFTV